MESNPMTNTDFDTYLKTPSEERIKDFAEYLMSHYCLDNGTDRYQLLEIEIYNDDIEYNQTPDDKKMDKNITYPRVKKALDIFYHYTGLDICFESNGKTHSGGILIRAVKKIDGGENSFIGGPLKLKDTILNEATSQICAKSLDQALSVELCDPTLRIGVHTGRSKKLWRFVVKGYENKIVTIEGKNKEGFNVLTAKYVNPK